jgi:hypothetical protein
MTSCGCLNGGRFQAVHGHSSSTGKHSPTYFSWIKMKERCLTPSHEAYARYGGAGVTIVPEWMTFENFLADMGERPKGTTLGRILDMGNYEKGNVFWQTWGEQGLSRRNKNALLKWAGAQ